MFPPHEPVLCAEIVDFLAVSEGSTYVDATVGMGGHAEALLNTDRRGRLLGIDRHAPSLELARQRLKPFGDRVAFHYGNFTDLKSPLEALGWGSPRGIIADLGISRWQLESAGVGLSFTKDEPLDMRLDGTGTSAYAMVNTYPAQDLARIFRTYGEEPMAGRIAKRIVERRAQAPVATTAELAHIVEAAKGRSRKPGLHPATQVFMALRIAVNDELGALESFLPHAIHTMALGGRLAIISFHSLEDRLVKRMFRNLSGLCICPPDGLPCRCAPQRRVSVITKKAVIASEEEKRRNPLSRSAKLRVAERLEP